jgi:hypothetical protein
MPPAPALRPGRRRRGVRPELALLACLPLLLSGCFTELVFEAMKDVRRTQTSCRTVRVVPKTIEQAVRDVAGGYHLIVRYSDGSTRALYHGPAAPPPALPSPGAASPDPEWPALTAEPLVEPSPYGPTLPLGTPVAVAPLPGDDAAPAVRLESNQLHVRLIEGGPFVSVARLHVHTRSVTEERRSGTAYVKTALLVVAFPVAVAGDLTLGALYVAVKSGLIVEILRCL